MNTNLEAKRRADRRIKWEKLLFRIKNVYRR
jgi:hypothetical protein